MFKKISLFTLIASVCLLQPVDAQSWRDKVNSARNKANNSINNVRNKANDAVNNARTNTRPAVDRLRNSANNLSRNASSFIETNREKYAPILKDYGENAINNLEGVSRKYGPIVAESVANVYERHGPRAGATITDAVNKYGPVAAEKLRVSYDTMGPIVGEKLNDLYSVHGPAVGNKVSDFAKSHGPKIGHLLVDITSEHGPNAINFMETTVNKYGPIVAEKIAFTFSEYGPYAAQAVYDGFSKYGPVIGDSFIYVYENYGRSIGNKIVKESKVVASKLKDPQTWAVAAGISLALSDQLGMTNEFDEVKSAILATNISSLNSVIKTQYLNDKDLVAFVAFAKMDFEEIQDNLKIIRGVTSINEHLDSTWFFDFNEIDRTIKKSQNLAQMHYKIQNGLGL